VALTQGIVILQHVRALAAICHDRPGRASGEGLRRIVAWIAAASCEKRGAPSKAEHLAVSRVPPVTLKMGIALVKLSH
jgi:hypothetical protein